MEFFRNAFLKKHSKILVSKHTRIMEWYWIGQKAELTWVRTINWKAQYCLAVWSWKREEKQQYWKLEEVSMRDWLMKMKMKIGREQMCNNKWLGTLNKAETNKFEEK